MMDPRLENSYYPVLIRVSFIKTFLKLLGDFEIICFVDICQFTWNPTSTDFSQQKFKDKGGLKVQSHGLYLTHLQIHKTSFRWLLRIICVTNFILLLLFKVKGLCFCRLLQKEILLFKKLINLFRVEEMYHWAHFLLDTVGQRSSYFKFPLKHNHIANKETILPLTDNMRFIAEHLLLCNIWLRWKTFLLIFLFSLKDTFFLSIS